MNKRSGIESRQRIIDAAMEVFSMKGYISANIREIAKAADISIGGVYIYFNNKEELYKNLISEKRSRLSSIIETTLEQSRSAAEALSAFINLNFDYALKHKEFILLHIREHGFAFGLEEKKQFFRQQIRHLEKIIKKGILAGEFRKCNSGNMARLIMGALRGIILSMALDNDVTVSPKTLTDLLLKGLIKDEDRC
jgi:AcrR family transcriptional regulator